MSDRNLESLRLGWEAFNRGDVQAIRALVTDDVEWGTTGAFPGLDVVNRGMAGIERVSEDLRSAWESFDVSIEEVLVEKDDIIVTRERFRGRGLGSGAEVEMPIYAVYWFRDGKLARRRSFMEQADAVEAAREG
jgi:ketosteroid isomerase-like protein